MAFPSAGAGSRPCTPIGRGPSSNRPGAALNHVGNCWRSWCSRVLVNPGPIMDCVAGDGAVAGPRGPWRRAELSQSSPSAVPCGSYRHIPPVRVDQLSHARGGRSQGRRPGRPQSGCACTRATCRTEGFATEPGWCRRQSRLQRRTSASASSGCSLPPKGATVAQCDVAFPGLRGSVATGPHCWTRYPRQASLLDMLYSLSRIGQQRNACSRFLVKGTNQHNLWILRRNNVHGYP